MLLTIYRAMLLSTVRSSSGPGWVDDECTAIRVYSYGDGK